uniref:cyclic pyranopterin monophosphate synthase n=1 Tax=Kalanchoe fedtschenkoi TaxID=63787 RepID=A0A7N0TDP3_KALFE
MFLCRRLITFSTARNMFCSNSGSKEMLGAIDELNKEMEFVFGEPPLATQSSSFGSSLSDGSVPASPVNEVNEPRLTHVGDKGEAQQVDVSTKAISYRTASASCKVILGQKAFDLVSANQIAKGDVLSVARIAGISGAKQTSNLIPLCHNICLTHVGVSLKLNHRNCSVEIEGEAACKGETGVEMEAMTATTIAGLTVYDMCKAVTKNIRITDVQLNRKTGGKSGDWTREDERN